MEAAPKCIAIMTQTVGYDAIDIQAATDNNIFVMNNPALSGVLKKFLTMQ